MCRVFKKRLATVRKIGDYESPCWYDQVSFMPELESPRRSISHPYASPYHQQQQHYSQCKQELDLQYNMPHHHHHDSFLQLPQLESPKVPQSAPYGSMLQSSTLTQEEQLQQHINQQQNMFNSSSSSLVLYNNNDQQSVDQVTDWRVLDKFVASQLSQDQQDASKEVTNYSNAASMFHVANMLANESSRRPDNENLGQDYASTSTSSCQIDLERR